MVAKIIETVLENFWNEKKCVVMAEEEIEEESESTDEDGEEFVLWWEKEAPNNYWCSSSPFDWWGGSGIFGGILDSEDPKKEEGAETGEGEEPELGPDGKPIAKKPKPIFLILTR